MTENPFKSGDYATMNEVPYDFSLTIGKMYLVKGVCKSVRGTPMITVTCDDGVDRNFYSSRFTQGYVEEDI